MNKINKKSGWHIYKRLIRIALLDNSKWIILAIIGMLLTAISDPALSAIMKPILDGAFIEKDPDVIKYVPFGLLGIFIVRSIGIFMTIYFMAIVGRSLVFRLRELMFDKLLYLPTSFYDKNSSGDLMSRISHNVELLSSTASRSLIILIRDSLTIFGLLLWMFYLNWILSLCFLVVAPFIILLVSKLNKRFRKLTHQTQNSVGNIINVSQEVLKGDKVIKIFDGYEYEKIRFENTNISNMKSHLKLALTEGTNSSIIMLLVGASLSGIILLSTYDFVLETITVGTFVSFMFAMLMLLGPSRGLASINARLQQGIAAGENIFQLIDEKNEVDDGKIKNIKLPINIRFKNVNFTYDTQQILYDISLDIESGKSIALVGKSGSGKSTLVNLIPRLYSSYDGQISFNDCEISEISIKEVRKNISYVGQNTILFNDSVINNITYGLEDYNKDLYEKAITESYANEFIEKLENKENTLIGENGLMLSGGQRQRLAIARAFLKDAPILIFDEATSSLDNISENYIRNSLDNLRVGRTTIIIAHRLSTIENVDEIVVLKEGKIVEKGRHNDLLNQKGEYYDLYKKQTFS